MKKKILVSLMVVVLILSNVVVFANGDPIGDLVAEYELTGEKIGEISKTIAGSTDEAKIEALQKELELLLLKEKKLDKEIIEAIDKQNEEMMQTDVKEEVVPAVIEVEKTIIKEDKQEIERQDTTVELDEESKRLIGDYKFKIEETEKEILDLESTLLFTDKERKIKQLKGTISGLKGKIDFFNREIARIKREANEIPLSPEDQEREADLEMHLNNLPNLIVTVSDPEKKAKLQANYDEAVIEYQELQAKKIRKLPTEEEEVNDNKKLRKTLKVLLRNKDNIENRRAIQEMIKSKREEILRQASLEEKEKFYNAKEKLKAALGNNETIMSMDSVISDTKSFKFDTPPVVKNGRTIVPIRAISEGFGAEVGWNQETQTVSILKGETVIELPLGNNIAIVNGEEFVLDSKAELMNSRTYVPLRFVSEALGLKVDWDQETQTVIINE